MNELRAIIANELDTLDGCLPDEDGNYVDDGDGETVALGLNPAKVAALREAIAELRKEILEVGGVGSTF